MESIWNIIICNEWDENYIQVTSTYITQGKENGTRMPGAMTTQVYTVDR